MKIDILTLFPEMFEGTKVSLIGRAQEKKLLEISCHNIRDYTTNKHNKVDDYIFGGGPGMLMMPEPVTRCLRDIGTTEKSRIIYLSPKGKILDRDKAEELANEEKITLLCGRYEGIDQRLIDAWNMEEISIGDYILTGGEPAALVLIDVVARMIEDIIGNKDSVLAESVYSGLLEAPHYTQPREFEGRKVPEVFLNGNHKAMELWKFEESLKITKERRPDLLEKYLQAERNFTKDEKKIIDKVCFLAKE